MIIAVAASKRSESSEIGAQAGRAPFFLIFNEQGALMEILKNPFSVGGGGAGFGVAKMLADMDVDAVAAAKFGPKMIGALKDRGVREYELNGTVKDALKKILEG